MHIVYTQGHAGTGRYSSGSLAKENAFAFSFDSFAAPICKAYRIAHSEEKPLFGVFLRSFRCTYKETFQILLAQKKRPCSGLFFIRCAASVCGAYRIAYSEKRPLFGASFHSLRCTCKPGSVHPEPFQAKDCVTIHLGVLSPTPSSGTPVLRQARPCTEVRI